MSSEKGTLLITGASGYLGGNMIKAAIEKGYNVRAVVRSNSSAQKVAAQFPQYKAQLSYAFVPDITKSDSYKGAFDGVSSVVHAASPFILNPKDNVKDLLKPAIHVKRIVATSSHASCVDISKGKQPGYVYDEKDWNPVTYEEASKAEGVYAYCASRALAERAMWDWVETNKPNFDLVTITPPCVQGFGQDGELKMLLMRDDLQRVEHPDQVLHQQASEDNGSPFGGNSPIR
ncbi:hypothetical protein AB5N19_13203 [Seiridium cardinale]